jgi:hypothetical protein
MGQAVCAVETPDFRGCGLSLPSSSPPHTQVEKVLGEYKDEGLIGVVNLIGDYNYVEMDTLEGDDIMKMMQVNCSSTTK